MKRPNVTIKLSTSLDGRIALGSGESRWITSEDSRKQAHRLRAAHDAIIIGARTARSDNPVLTVRHGPLPDPPPTRIVMDSRARLDAHSALVRTLDAAPVVVAATPAADATVCATLRDLGVDVWTCAAASDGVALSALLERCTRAGIGSILVEGGGTLAASFIRESLVDRLEWFRAPVLIGGDGIAGPGRLGLMNIEQMPRFVCVGRVELGDDLWETYKPAR